MMAATLIIGAFSVGSTPIADAAATNSAGRILRVVSSGAAPGGQAVVSVELDSMGDEVALSFSLNFDPTVLNSPVVTLGSDVPSGTIITRNLNQAANGRIGVLLDSSNTFAASPAARQVVVVTFGVAGNAPAGPSLVTFGNLPAGRSTSDGLGNLVATGYQDGAVTILGATPAPVVEIGGRVFNSSGAGLRNATVILSGPNDLRRSVPTSSMGFYNFSDVESGQIYTVSVASRQYRFEPITVQVDNAISNLNFTGLE